MSTLTEKKARNLAFSYKKFHPMPLYPAERIRLNAKLLNTNKTQKKS